eukprot:4337346-Pyramimonas_sp.AAC.1
MKLLREAFRLAGWIVVPAAAGNAHLGRWKENGKHDSSSLILLSPPSSFPPPHPRPPGALEFG